MKIKLVLIDITTEQQSTKPIQYFIDTDKTEHMDTWQYSPDYCTKTVETVFD